MMYSGVFCEADILVIDDNAINVEVVLHLLEDVGYLNVEGITNPLLVEQRVRKQRPDLILLDLRMPTVSGLDLLYRLKKEHNELLPPVIILSELSDEATCIQALSLGAQDFLSKPFNHIEVIQRIHNTLHLQRLIKESTQKNIELETVAQARTHELIQLSRQDPVTALPNRVVILETLDQLLQRSLSTFTFFIALEGLEELASLHGYEIADEACRLLANNIQLAGEPFIQLLGVWSSNQWVVLIMGDEERLNTAQLAQHLLEVIHTPLYLKQLKLHVRAKIGINGAVVHSTPKRLIRQAALAVPHQTGGWQIYSKTIENNLLRKVQLRDALHQAIERNELYLLYQPQIHLQSKKIIGVEALLRWEHPSLGRVMPSEFIPAAESSGDIISIGKWVIQEAISALSQWREQGHVAHDFTIAVNVSSMQLAQADFAHWLIKTLQQSSLPASAIELEITESDLMQNMETALIQLNRLNAAGFRVAIDDFGTGYSSLAYLKSLPAHIIKIDRAFISELHRNIQDQRITGTIIDMARHLRFTTIAEGVDKPEQLQLLLEMGCDMVQGFLFAPPLPQLALLKMIQEQPKGMMIFPAVSSSIEK
ncbi:EAL domain-containing protein [Paenalcaligenes hominis]|uniref:GGDEF/EAL domain-containing response regulator n=1 Tax=Paenalcaligenes hominis TaxID=643674 RepID=UPI003523F38B